MFFKKKKASDPLSAAIDELKKRSTSESQRKVFSIFRDYVEKGEWVFSTGEEKEKGILMQTVQERGKNYIPLYTDAEYIKSKSGSVVETDINKYLESLYSNKDVSGLVLNPGSQDLYLDKEFILKILIHDKFPKQNNAGSPQRNWGSGIPRYSDDDIMTKGQMLNFAMHIVHDYDLKNSDYIPISYCDNTDSDINYIMKKGNDIFFIVVYPYVFPKEPEFENGLKSRVMDLCKKYHCKCLFAPVGLCPADEQRAAAGLLLKGDGFYVNYRGMELIEPSDNIGECS